MDVVVDRKYSEKNTHTSVNGHIKIIAVVLLLESRVTLDQFLLDLVFFLICEMGLIITFWVIVRTEWSTSV